MVKAITFRPEFYNFNTFNNPEERRESTGDEEPVFYSKNKYSSVNEFINHNDFSRCCTEYSNIIDRMISLVHDNANNIKPEFDATKVSSIKKNLNTLRDHISNLDVDYFSSHKDTIYGSAKEFFHEFDKLLGDERIPLQKRMYSVAEIAPQITLCSGGIVTALQDAISNLKHGTAGLKGAVYIAKRKMAEALIVEHVKRVNPGYPYQNEVHYVNAYMDNMAADLGFNQSNDRFVSSVLPHITRGDFELCRHTVFEKLNPTLLSKNIASQYLEKVKEVQPEGIKESFGGDELTDVFNRIKNIKQATLNSEFGDVPPGTYLIQNEGTDEYRFSRGPTLLAKHIIEVLKTEKLVDFDDSVTLANDEDNQKIKILGDLFWRDNSGDLDEFNISELSSISPNKIFEKLNQKAELTSPERSAIFGEIANAMLNNLGDEDIGKISNEWLTEISGLFKRKVISHDDIIPTLHLAATLGFDNVLKDLIKGGVDINAPDLRGNTASHLAAVHNNKKSLNFLRRKGANIHSMNNSGDTPLACAAKNNSVEAARVLLGVSQKTDITKPKGIAFRLMSVGKSRREINAQDTSGQNLVMKAARAGSADVLRLFLWAGGAVNIVDSSGRTPLMHAVNAQKGLAASAVTTLINAGANLDERDPNGDTALMIAVRHDKELVARVLIEAGADVKIPNNRGTNPLMRAAFNDNANMVVSIINAGAPLEEKDSQGLTAIFHAAHGLTGSTVRVLIDSGADIEAKSSGGYSPLMIAAFQGTKEAVQVLINAGAKLEELMPRNSAGLTALMLASQQGRTEIVEELVNASANVETKSLTGVTALMCAVNNRQSETASRLLDFGANPNGSENFKRPLTMAIEFGDLELVEKLIYKGANLESTDKGYTPLLAALDSGKYDIAQSLIRGGAKLDAVTPDKGLSPVAYAASSNNLGLLQAMIDNGLTREQLEIRTKLGATPLLLAADSQQLDVLDALIKAGADIDATYPDNDFSALFFAACRGDLDVMTLLIEGGADINVPTSSNGFTPLARAAFDGNVEVMKFLLDLDARTDIKTSLGYSIEELCLQGKKTPELKAEMLKLVEVANNRK